MDEKTKQKYDRVMHRVQKGDYHIKEHFPKDVQVAVESFFRATKMMIDEGLDTVPNEYLINVIDTLSKYPEYNKITMDLVKAWKMELPK
tara:strand:+ start:372 stop:638 length:267 start_codon:yes stop_codon:yes gene_type:complete